jgi:hypothetical protein
VKGSLGLLLVGPSLTTSRIDGVDAVFFHGLEPVIVTVVVVVVFVVVVVVVVGATMTLTAGCPTGRFFRNQISLDVN